MSEKEGKTLYEIVTERFDKQIKDDPDWFYGAMVSHLDKSGNVCYGPLSKGYISKCSYQVKCLTCGEVIISKNHQKEQDI